MKQQTIRYKDLSIWLKIAVVTSWIILGLWIAGFLIGFLGAV